MISRFAGLTRTRSRAVVHVGRRAAGDGRHGRVGGDDGLIPGGRELDRVDSAGVPGEPADVRARAAVAEDHLVPVRRGDRHPPAVGRDCCRPTDEDGRVGFSAGYTLLTGGLEADTFGAVCESLCKEAGEVDAGLRQKGLV